MNKKISLGIAISLVAIGCAITFVLTWTVSLNIYNSKLGTSEKYEGVYAKLREIDTTVRQNYIGSVSDDSLENATINGYIAGIGDKYASYIAPSAYYELQQTQSGVILGAGFEAEEDTSGYLKITTVYRGSSAELNGVLAGDIITAIDGKSLLSMQQGQAMERLSGEVGTRLALQLLRDELCRRQGSYRRRPPESRRSSQRPETNTKPVRSVRDSRYCGILRRQPQDPH